MDRYAAEADSNEIPPTMNRDSIENGMRVFTVEKAFYANPCYYDSIKILLDAGLEENQIRPITITMLTQSCFKSLCLCTWKLLTL